MKNFDNEIDSTPDTRSTPQFQAARKDIMRVVKKLKKGESITYGYLSRRVRNVELLDYAIADLAAENALRYNPNGVLPTRIYKA
jgi:hypothetical protein